MSNLVPHSPTTVRRLTAASSSAIATIAVAGPDAACILSSALIGASGQALSLMQPRAQFARWRFTDRHLADEHVVVLVRDSRSIEIHCHGGMAITELIIEQLLVAGAEVIGDKFDPAKFDPAKVDQIMDNGESNEGQTTSQLESAVSDGAIESSAHQALLRSTTLKTSIVLLEQLQGALVREFNMLRELEAGKRYQEALELCALLLERAQFGTKLLAPWRLTLAGPPNVGKSSLMNALCGAVRVLVHHEPGTTRDAIETDLVIGGWPLKLTDTAGIRETHEAIEQQGVQTAWQRWQRADVGLLVVDATEGWTQQHSLLTAGPTTLIVVLNKMDAVTEPACLPKLIATFESECLRPCHAIVTASAMQANGVASVVEKVSDYLNSIQPAPKSGIPFTSDQVAWLQAVRQRLNSKR